jgi:hypothetical protein
MREVSVFFMEVILMHIRVFLTILIAISVVLVPADPLKSEDYEGYIEDLIEIQVIDNKVIAFRDGKDPVSFQLPRIESVLWKSSKGNLGAVLTDTRFLAISMTSKGWHETSLRMNEAVTASVVLSNAIALLVTSERAIGFDYVTNAFVEQRLRLEKPVASDANMYVAAVVSTERAYGLAMGSRAFVEKRFGMNERFESLETKSRLATVRTTERVLSFQASDSSWTEVDRSIFEWSKPQVGGISGRISPKGVSVRIIAKKAGTEYGIKENIKGEVTLTQGGSFTIWNVPPGKYDLLFFVQGHARDMYMGGRWSEIVIEPGKTVSGINYRLTPEGSEYAIDEVCVQFHKDTKEEDAPKVIQSLNCIIKDKHYRPGFYTVDIPDDKSVNEMIKAFNKKKEVLYAGPNSILRAQSM